jgi:hypothetical protein
MPKTGSLPSDASAEVGAAAYARRSHEAHNGTDGEEQVEDEAYEHKPIQRGDKHRR